MLLSGKALKSKGDDFIMTFSPCGSNKVKFILIVIHQKHFGYYYKSIALKSKQMLIKRKLLGLQIVLKLKISLNSIQFLELLKLCFPTCF